MRIPTKKSSSKVFEDLTKNIGPDEVEKFVLLDALKYGASAHGRCFGFGLDRIGGFNGGCRIYREM